jgi:type VI secretion system protein ImpF
MAELARGSCVPLFDRLSQTDSVTQGQLMTPQQLELSIARELSRLFNTRSRLTVGEFSAAVGTLDYGIPDVSSLSPRSQQDMERLQGAVAHAIRCYEPRLKNVKVKAFASASGQAAAMLISGEVTIQMKLQPLSFELQLDARHGGLAKAG